MRTERGTGDDADEVEDEMPRPVKGETLANVSAVRRNGGERRSLEFELDVDDGRRRRSVRPHVLPLCSSLCARCMSERCQQVARARRQEKGSERARGRRTRGRA